MQGFEEIFIEGRFAHEKVKQLLQLRETTKWPIKNADSCLGFFSTKVQVAVVMAMPTPSKKLSTSNEKGVHTNPYKATLCYGLLKKRKVTHLHLNMKACISTQE